MSISATKLKRVNPSSAFLFYAGGEVALRRTSYSPACNPFVFLKWSRDNESSYSKADIQLFVLLFNVHYLDL